MAIMQRSTTTSHALLLRLQTLVSHLQRCKYSDVAGDGKNPGSEITSANHEHGSFDMSTWKKVDSRALGIQRSSIPHATLMLLDVIRRYGFEAYLVGGCVRDLLMQKPPKDFDVITNASLEEIKNQFRRSRIVGRHFPICHVYIKNSLTEVSSFSIVRKDVADGQPIYPPKLPNDCYKEDFARWKDSLRRDFTINSLFYDPFVNKVYDYVGGIQDLRISKVRTVIPAHLSFKEDCARILRGLRIAARLDLQFCEETAAAIRDLSSSILTICKERLFLEMHYLLAYGASESSLRLLHKFKLLELVLPLQAAYLDNQVKKGSAESSTMLMKLFSNADKLLATDRPSNRNLWVALLSLHLALVCYPQDARVVRALCSIMYHGTWRKATTFAKEGSKADVQFSPEIFACSRTKSEESLLADTSNFASLIQHSLNLLTDEDAMFQRLTMNDPVPYSGFVFVPKAMKRHLGGLFKVLATNIRSYDMERKTNKIDYNRLKSGDPSETLFVLGKIIMDTMEADVFVPEQNQEAAARETHICQLTCEENKDLVFVEECPQSSPTREQTSNMTAVDKSCPDGLTSQKNQNVSAAADKWQLCKLTDEWYTKVHTTQSYDYDVEENQKVSTAKEVSKPSGQKNQKMIATNKIPKHTGEQVSKMKSANGSGKQNGDRNVEALAAEAICIPSGNKHPKLSVTNKIETHTGGQDMKNSARKKSIDHKGGPNMGAKNQNIFAAKKRWKDTDEEDQEVQVESRTKHNWAKNQEALVAKRRLRRLERCKHTDERNQEVHPESRTKHNCEKNQKVGAANMTQNPNQKVSEAEKIHLGRPIEKSSQNMIAPKTVPPNEVRREQVQNGASVKKIHPLSSLFR